MRTHSDDLTPLIPPSAIDMTMAEEASRLVARYVNQTGSAIKVQFRENGKSVEIALPPLVVRLLFDILKDMAKGKPVTVIPVDMDLTTQQAAEFLNVSRPFFVGLLEKGALKYKKVGTHRRICVSDLLAYKKKIEAEQDEAMKELAQQAQELNMGY
ncbi:MAG TPA: DNA-binding protein [Rhodospirillaceae bacterium]|nr:DNA-binding protein [Rhodospirillaceae bacterium]